MFAGCKSPCNPTRLGIQVGQLGIRFSLVLDGFDREIYCDELDDDRFAESVDYAGRLIPDLNLALRYDDDARLVITDAAGNRYPTPTEPVVSPRTHRPVSIPLAPKAESARTEADTARVETERLRDLLRDAGIDPDA